MSLLEHLVVYAHIAERMYTPRLNVNEVRSTIIQGCVRAHTTIRTA